MPINREISPFQSIPPLNRQTTNLPKTPISRCTLRLAILLCILITLPIYILNLYHIQEWVDITLPLATPTQQSIQCVKPIGSSTADNIAQFITDHQLAIFIANLHFARVSFPPLTGIQSRFIRTFADCLPPSTRCTIRQADIPPVNCQPGDCACLAVKIGDYVNPRAACPVLGVVNNGLNNYEFSGCMGTTLRRYLSLPSRWPRSFDAVQYVHTPIDTESMHPNNGQAYTNERFEHLMHAMCVMSDRDIIVISDHTPSIPLCGNRTILARVTDEEAIMISAHAIHLSVTGGPIGRLMMEVSTARRVILLLEVQKWFLWIKEPEITLVRKDGYMFSTHNAVADLNVEQEIEYMELVTGKRRLLHGPAIPHRRWENEAAPF